MKKAQLRAIMQSKIKRINNRGKKSKAIRSRLSGLIREILPKRLFVFAPIEGEPNLWPQLSGWSRSGIKLYFPKVKGKAMTYHRASRKKDLNPGEFGILEPTNSKIIKPESGDIFLIPAIAATVTGYRLGHGRGFFDRFLARNPRLWTIGILYETQITSKLKPERHDIPLKGLITDKRFIAV